MPTIPNQSIRICILDWYLNEWYDGWRKVIVSKCYVTVNENQEEGFCCQGMWRYQCFFCVIYIFRFKKSRFGRVILKINVNDFNWCCLSRLCNNRMLMALLAKRNFIKLFDVFLFINYEVFFTISRHLPWVRNSLKTERKLWQ